MFSALKPDALGVKPDECAALVAGVGSPPHSAPCGSVGFSAPRRLAEWGAYASAEQMAAVLYHFWAVGLRTLVGLRAVRCALASEGVWWIVGFAMLAVLALTLGGIDRFLGGRIWDWGHFYYAAEALSAGESPYLAGRRGYIYPVTFAWLIQPLVGLGFEASAAVWIGLMGLASAVSLGLMFVFVKALPERASTAGWALLVAFVLVGDKFTSVLKNAQTDGLLLVCFVFALLAIRRFPIAAGLAIALAACVKYHALIFVVLFCVRGRWRAGAAAGLGFVALVLAPALTLGWQTNLGYLGDAFGGMVDMVADAPADRSGDSLAQGAQIRRIGWDRSISVTCAFARFGDWLGAGIGPGAGLALGYGALVLLMAGVGLSCAVGYKRAGVNPFERWAGQAIAPDRLMRLDLCDFSLVITVLIVFAPQTTARHFVYALVPLTAIVLAAFCAGSGRARWALLGGCGLFFLALNLPLSDYPDLMNAWRRWSVAAWVLLGLAMALPWTGLIGPPRLGAKAH